MDESELRAFFCRHCITALFSFYSMPLFLRGREKEIHGVPFHLIYISIKN